jgi:hypothetical protein
MAEEDKEKANNPEKIIEGKTSKIKNWLKNPYNLAFVGILISAIIIRLYYFSLTKSQPLWWDEAEYGLKAKAFAFGTPTTGWASQRELIVPFIFSIIFRLGGSEVILKFIQILVSIATIAMTYVTISKISSKKIGIFASFGMAFFWLEIFFAQRLLVYLWAPLMFLVITYFFYTGYIHENKKNLIIFSIVSAVGLMTYFSVGFLLFGIFVYLLISEGYTLFINKKAWKAFIIFFIVLLPFMIYFQMTLGSPIPRLTSGVGAVIHEPGAGLAGLFAYISMFPSRAGWTFTILSFVGALYVLGTLILGLGIKNYFKNNKWLLTFICFFVPFACYTLYGTIGGSATFYDAFILPVFPFAFALAGLSLDKLQSYLSKYSKIIAIFVIVVLLAIHAYGGIVNSSVYIKPKISSYDNVKYAGVWLKENTIPGDVIISWSTPQITYYSERETYAIYTNQSDLEKSVAEKKPKFLVDSMYESRQPWLSSYLEENNKTFTPVMGYFLDEAKTQPALITYKISY